MQLEMMVAEEKYCGYHFGSIICAVTWDDDKGPCDGDSGGPLVCQEHDRKWYLRGVLSRTQAQCKLWGVFTKVSDYENWIHRVLSSKKRILEDRKNSFVILSIN